MKPTELRAQLERLHAESFGWALACTGRNETEAEDVLQTSYLKVMEGRAHFHGRSSFKTWFFGVIRRTAQEVARRRRTEARRLDTLSLGSLRDPQPETGGGDPATGVERAQAVERLVRALPLLSERQREVLHLVFYQDLTIAEAAEVMGVSVGSARTHYERGKSRLRALLRELASDDR